MKAKIVAATIVALLAAPTLGAAYAVSAYGASAPHVKIDVCHATGSETNPYVLINVNVNSVGVANDLNGHAGHEGDAWASFEYDGVTYPGQGDMALCSGQPPVDPTVVAPITSVTPATCDSAAVLVLTPVEGVEYATISGSLTGPGEVVVQVTADEGFVLADEGDATITTDLSGPLAGCSHDGGIVPPSTVKARKCGARLAMKGKCQLTNTGVSIKRLVADSGSRVQGG